MDTPRVFISYAWTNQDHEFWVLSLAERLVSDGIDIVIDKWNLEPGQDKYVFMEKMVQDPTITNVLLILNEQYKKKSDARSGGVGTEAQIISSELYDKTEQKKFIPIIAERDDSGREFAPIFLKNRIYIDLTLTGSYETEYEKLVRFVYKKPITSKPQLGTPPAYLMEDRSNPAPLRTLEKSLASSIERRSQRMFRQPRPWLTTGVFRRL